MTTRFLSLLMFSLLSGALFAQRVIDVDKYDGSALNFFRTVGGEPVMGTKFVRLVEGTPYFSDEWMRGSVFIEESEYRNILLRINILDATLEFRDSKGESMVCSNPIKRVVLNDTIKGAQYSFTHSSFLPDHGDLKRCWLLQLASGKADLFKIEKKQVNEMRPYGSATTEQRIVSIYNYYLLSNGQLTRIKKTTDISDILSSQNQALQDYIKTNKLSSKDERDLVRLVNYYNSL